MVKEIIKKRTKTLSFLLLNNCDILFLIGLIYGLKNKLGNKFSGFLLLKDNIIVEFKKPYP